MDAKTEVEELLRGFAEAVGNQDAVACAAFYSDDALLLPDDAPALSGTSAIEEMFHSMFQGGVRSTELTTLDVIEEGTLVVETGEFTLTIEPSGRFDGKYLNVYQRQPDGGLKCIREATNRVAPA